MRNKGQSTINPTILREYDIRGTFGKTLNTDVAFEIGQRFASFLLSNNSKSICVGRDGRLSSPELSQALIQGLTKCGCDVIDIGVGPTPMLYFSVKHFMADAGIMITGSHNPKDDNGFKMLLKDRPFFGPDIQQLASQPISPVSHPGSVRTEQIQEKYIERLIKDYSPTSKRLKITIDAGNGATGEIADRLSQKLNCDIILLNTKIDGTFPSHHPDPADPKNLQEIIEYIKTHNLDFGIAFDGDGDRIGVVADDGCMVWGDQLTMLYARDVLQNSPGATIIADVKSSQTLFDDIKANGGIPIMSPTGHSIIKVKMAETKASFAGEMSGHTFFADKYYGYDDALYAMIRLLNIMHTANFKLSNFLKSLPKTVTTPEIRLEYDDVAKFQIVKDIRNSLNQQNIPFNDIDGIRMQTNDGWWLLRASNTQPALVVRFEAKSQASLEQLKHQFKKLTNIEVPK